jgi:hypothetical protein
MSVIKLVVLLRFKAIPLSCARRIAGKMAQLRARIRFLPRRSSLPQIL